MKRLVYLLIAVSLMLALVPAVASADEITVVLKAGQTEDIGHVKVWNDAENLYVQFVSTGDCLLETHVAVGTSLDDIPQTKKENPIPGQFEFSDPHACVQEYTYEIPLTWPAGTDLYIAAHAATGVQDSMWVFSNGDESFTAYTGPGTASYPCIASTRTGTAVAAWQHPAWGSVTSQFTYGTWIWEAYRAVDPICGTVVDFEETFDIPGEFTDGTLWVTADNGYEAYLNGTLLETDGLSGDWRNSDLTESYVTTAQAAWSSIEIATWLQLTGNVLRFETANEYFNTDDGHGSAGTVDSNPGGLIYEAEIIYYADGETAWGNGSDFPGKNWGMYFTYTVQEPPPPVIAGWDTGRGGNYSLNHTDSAQAQTDLQDKYGDVEFHALSALDATSLADVDVVVLSSVKGNSGAITPWLSEPEQDALYDFVLGGGCAILFPDNDTFAGGNSDPANESLIDPFGLDIMGTLSDGYNATVTSAPSPVTSGVAGYSGNYAGWFDGTGGATVLATITVSGQNQTSLVEFAPGHFGTGSGRVVVFSDANVFFGGSAGKYSSNSQLFLNSVDACFQP